MTQVPEETQETQETRSNNPLVGVKVVVNVVEGAVMVGVSRGPVDPHLEKLEVSPDEGLEAILAAVPEVLERARARWEGTPRFPAYQAPPAATGTERTRQQTQGRRQGTGGQSASGGEVQAPRMF